MYAISIRFHLIIGSDLEEIRFRANQWITDQNLPDASKEFQLEDTPYLLFLWAGHDGGEVFLFPGQREALVEEALEHVFLNGYEYDGYDIDAVRGDPDDPHDPDDHPCREYIVDNWDLIERTRQTGELEDLNQTRIAREMLQTHVLIDLGARSQITACEDFTIYFCEQEKPVEDP